MKKIFTLIALACMGYACTPGATPPIASQIGATNYTPGRVVWHDLASPNPEASAAFYESVFGWTTVPYGEDEKMVWIFKKEDKPVALMAYYQTENNSGEWIGAISVPDVSASTQKAKNQGAKVLKKAMEVDNRGTISFIQDPQGAHISLVKLANGDPEPTLAEINTFLGQELWSNDTDDSESFYSNVVGYTSEETDNQKVPYTIFKMGDLNCAGMLKNPAPTVRSHWVPYLRVADLSETIAKATRAGGKVLIEPNPEIRNGNVALLMDPTGAPLAVQVYNP
ncbi:VOC family protein [Algoriphagus halophytocola]|uniref:VOC family protein n=1 Tax=Algoriphagus halophytocola TaxID=2991499 RepID=A0ABY6MKF3_9BACT|nr:VOC family protein [Algoriphagus sp. TR-M5]UZD24260.1 VOC family protein [Algoriphagus sp. TR-M5]